MVEVADIDWIEAAGNYAILHVGGDTFEIRSSLTKLEGELDPKRFVRVHKSHVVNIARVAEVTPWVSGDWRIRLQDGAEVNLSRRYRQRFEALALVGADRSSRPHRRSSHRPPLVTIRPGSRVWRLGRGSATVPRVSATTDRRADLDWLRVSAFALLILYHSGMAWSGWTWHLTSPDSIDWLREAMRFLNRWRMPLIFVVSGAAIMLALGTRSPAVFARDRVRRLLLPLAFGMVVLVPPQVYLERLYSGQFTGSFSQWLPQAFTGVYPAGNMSWHHLWFLAYVLVLTFVLLPYFLWARSARARAVAGRGGAVS